MNYHEAIALAKSGRRVRRSAWAQTWLHLSSESGSALHLTVDGDGRKPHAVPFVPRIADVDAQDWTVMHDDATPAEPGKKRQKVK